MPLPEIVSKTFQTIVGVRPENPPMTPAEMEQKGIQVGQVRDGQKVEEPAPVRPITTTKTSTY